MAFDTNGMFRDNNLIGNYPKMLWAIADYIESNAVAAELGIKVVGEVENVADIPEGEYSYGDAYMVGTEAPYEMYIWTRANGNHPEDYWFDVGHFPMPGPQGEPGPGVTDTDHNVISLPAASISNLGTNLYGYALQGETTQALTDNTSATFNTAIGGYLMTDGQVTITQAAGPEDDTSGIKIGLSKNLDTSYVQQKSPYDAHSSLINGMPVVYGKNCTSSSKVNTVNVLPILLGTTNNVVMFGQKMTTALDYDAANNNTIASTDSRFNTVLGKGNQLTGTGTANANTENLVFGGKNILSNGVQDSATFGYRNEVYANQAMTHGYKNKNYGSESIVMGNQNTLNGTITVDTTPDENGGYDGASSDSKQCAVFGNKNTLGTSNQQMLVAGDQNTIGNNSKWGFVAGSHHSIGKDNFCVNAIDYGNISERYVEDCTMIGYYNHIYGGPNGSNKVYAVNMIGHDNTNVDGNSNNLSDVVLIGSGLKPSQQNCTIIGRYNSPLIGDFFEIGKGIDDNNRSNLFAVGVDPQDGPVIILDGVTLTKTKLQALLALV